MSQEQLKEQAYDYITNNLNNKAVLEVINELLETIENEMIEDGYKRESNRLVTAELIINEVLQNG